MSFPSFAGHISNESGGLTAESEKGDNKMESTKLEEIGKAVASMLGGAVSSQAPQLPGLLLQLLADGKPLSPKQIVAELDVSPDDLASALQQSTAVELDEDGNVVAAFGLSLNPTPHSFEVGGNALHTWCALDTLYIPAVINQTARVESTCPVTGARIRLSVKPGGVESLEPADAVVVIAVEGASQGCGSIQKSFCDHVHFLSSPDAASEWSADRQMTIILSVDDAHKVGGIMVEHIFEKPSGK
jgi:alkylmercury lyase